MKELEIKSVIRKKEYIRKYTSGKSCVNHLNRKFKVYNPLEKILYTSHRLSFSISRKRNCWDNVPIESFFSHFIKWAILFCA